MLSRRALSSCREAVGVALQVEQTRLSSPPEPDATSWLQERKEKKKGNSFSVGQSNLGLGLKIANYHHFEPSIVILVPIPRQQKKVVAVATGTCERGPDSCTYSFVAALTAQGFLLE